MLCLGSLEQVTRTSALALLNPIQYEPFDASQHPTLQGMGLLKIRLHPLPSYSRARREGAAEVGGGIGAAAALRKETQEALGLLLQRLRLRLRFSEQRRPAPPPGASVSLVPPPVQPPCPASSSSRPPPPFSSSALLLPPPPPPPLAVSAPSPFLPSASPAPRSPLLPSTRFTGRYKTWASLRLLTDLQISPATPQPTDPNPTNFRTIHLSARACAYVPACSLAACLSVCRRLWPCRSQRSPFFWSYTPRAPRLVFRLALQSSACGTRESKAPRHIFADKDAAPHDDEQRAASIASFRRSQHLKCITCFRPSLAQSRPQKGSSNPAQIGTNSGRPSQRSTTPQTHSHTHTHMDYSPHRPRSTSWGLGLRCGVRTSGCGLQGFGFRASCCGFRGAGFRFQVSGSPGAAQDRREGTCWRELCDRWCNG
jgi:hypothetical protein